MYTSPSVDSMSNFSHAPLYTGVEDTLVYRYSLPTYLRASGCSGV